MTRSKITDSTFFDATAWHEALRRLDPAWARAAHYLFTGQSHEYEPDCAYWGFVPEDYEGDQRIPVRIKRLVAVHELLEVRRERVERGDTIQILYGVDLCARESLPMPAWLADSFCRAFSRLTSTKGDASSLDEVFSGEPFPDRTEQRMRNLRSDTELGAQLWHDVRKATAEHTSFDKAVEAVLASGRHACQKSKAKRLVMMIDENQVALSGGVIRPLSHFFPKLRKR